MVNIIVNQEFLVYLVDADTKQLIRRNFKYNSSLDPFGDSITYHQLMLGGTLLYKFKEIIGVDGSMRFSFDESQITEFGYNYNSITGNDVSQYYDPEVGGYLFPSVVIIYMSKLK